jgi:serine/threonine protein kinase
MKNYIIEKTLGEGAQGTVLLARDKKIGRLVAIKSLHPNLISDVTNRERFIEEIKILDELKGHPSIVTLYHYEADENNYNMYMEYFKGTPLDEYIKNTSGPIAEINTIDIILQILEGIDFMHKKNIIHRDIKPSNILINEFFKIKLIDFGISKNNQVNSKLTILGNGVGGSPMYMSPEHISDEPITFKTDIYSLGVTLWQMLTGVAPYEGMPIGVIYKKILSEPLKDIQSVYLHVSKKMNEIVQKATNKNPEERYHTCRNFIEDLKELKYILIKEQTETVHKKNINIIIKNTKNAKIKINSKEHFGDTASCNLFPGEELKIIVKKKGYQSYRNNLIVGKEDIELEVVLNKDKKPIILIFIAAIGILLLIIKNYKVPEGEEVPEVSKVPQIVIPKQPKGEPIGFKKIQKKIDIKRKKEKTISENNMYEDYETLANNEKTNYIVENFIFNVDELKKLSNSEQSKIANDLFNDLQNNFPNKESTRYAICCSYKKQIITFLDNKGYNTSSININFNKCP